MILYLGHASPPLLTDKCSLVGNKDSVNFTSPHSQALLDLERVRGKYRPTLDERKYNYKIDKEWNFCLKKGPRYPSKNQIKRSKFLFLIFFHKMFSWSTFAILSLTYLIEWASVGIGIIPKITNLYPVNGIGNIGNWKSLKFYFAKSFFPAIKYKLDFLYGSEGEYWQS